MPPAIPLATYRIQLTKDFSFDDAAKLAPYLKSLGITHVYASPFLKARPGSTHGYDIVDHNQLNPELGGEEGFARLSVALKQNNLGLILDFVPNHMGVGHSDNAWWLDVLEWGPKSPYVGAFDIDWEGLPYRRNPGVLLPILGCTYGDALQNGDIALKYDKETGSFAAWYFDHKLPINPQRYGEILRTVVNAAGANDELPGQRLIALAHKHRDPGVPSYSTAPDLKARIATINGGKDIIERGLVAYRHNSQTEATALHRLLERQYYRLAYWRVAFSAVNYRRFFDVNDLAGLRVEDPKTFRGIHPLVGRLISDGQLQGLRLDHIDGLRDPAQYTRRLRQLVGKLRREAGQRGPFYLIVEKILGEEEPMPKWPGVYGTTGYEWLNVISHVLVDGDGIASLDRTWRNATGERANLRDMLGTAKQRVIETMLASEFTVLTRALARIAAGHFSTRDYTLDRLRAALQAYVLEFPVYRTYVTAGGASPRDREMIESTIKRARARWGGPDPEIFDLLRETLTTDLAANSGYSPARVRNFALKLQQFTGPLMAKALEDTTFYRHHRLLALNEVGGDPEARPLTLSEFHTLQQRRAEAPFGLTATATHDTKRGEDARARILSLSEIPEDWATAVQEWRNQTARLSENGRPSAAHQYMLFQALIGAWPVTVDESFVKRMQAYALKAAREGKQETSWTNPDDNYENALKNYVAKVLDKSNGEFVASFEAFATRTSLLGALNGLSQIALKVLLPGVPDFYQGTEHWDFSLVDPDNRRAVDFTARVRDVASSEDWSSLAARWQNGGIKIALTKRLLALRHMYAELFGNGDYAPLAATGPQANHVIAFARVRRREKIIVAVGRHFAPLTNGGRQWPGTIDAKLSIEGEHEMLLGGGAIDALDFSRIPIRVLRRL